MSDIDRIRAPDMDDKKVGEGGHGDTCLQNNTGSDDAAAIPRGEVDPVYEAKARVLNRAVSRASSVERRASVSLALAKPWSSGETDRARER